jgi:hypothetical protein
MRLSDIGNTSNCVLPGRFRSRGSNLLSRHTDQSIERFSGPVEQQTREQASGDEAIAACDALF